MEEGKIVHQATKIPFRIKLIIGFHLFSLVLRTIGQGGAVIAYDTVAKWGFQAPRESLDPIIVEVNRGIGLTDFVIQMPLFIFAAIGLWRRQFYGAVCSWLVLGIILYRPVIDWSKRYFFAQATVKHLPAGIISDGIIAFFFLFAIWASWYIFKNRTLFE